jgi:GntP family gluconate:H+ symporter
MELQLLLALVLGIGTIIFLVLRTRIDAFVALLLAALVTGFDSVASCQGRSNRFE